MAVPNHSALSRIRDRYGLDIFQAFFEQLVERCQAAGLVLGAELYFGGTKVRANASIDKRVPRFVWEVQQHLQSIFVLSPQATTSKNTRGTHCQAKRVGMKSLDQTVIENLLAHVLTMDNLRPLAVNMAQSLEERSHDAGTRMMALEDKLAEVQESLENIMDAIEKMGYDTHLQQRYDVRKREEEELLSELAVLKALQINPRQIAQISDEVLEGWIYYMRDALEDEGKALARQIIQQFVAKIVIKEGTGTLYYTFPFPDDLYISDYGNLTLVGLEPTPID